MKEQLEVTDLKGNKIGIMNVEVAPCDEKGREYTEADDKFVDSPDDLVGKNVSFIFKIQNCRYATYNYSEASRDTIIVSSKKSCPTKSLILRSISIY